MTESISVTKANRAVYKACGNRPLAPAECGKHIHCRRNISKSFTAYLGFLNSVVLPGACLATTMVMEKQEAYRKALSRKDRNVLQQRVKELEVLNDQLKASFLNLIHEAKTPLTLINNYLEECMGDSTNIPNLKFIKRNLEKLTKDITHLFNAERLLKGWDHYNHQHALNLSLVLQENIELFDKVCQSKAISLRANIKEGLFIQAAPDAIDSIVRNLMENAITFSNPGDTIEIELKQIKKWVHFSIQDQGVGIPPEFHQKVFEPYFQVPAKRKTKGMGLGLSIVKKIVSSLQGSVSINSNFLEEPGTCVTVTFRLCTNAQELAIKHASNIPRDDLKLSSKLNLKRTSSYQSDKRSIFLIVDQPELLDYLLKKLGNTYNVFYALDGEEALIKLKNIPFDIDLIILDLMMKLVDGYKLLHQLKTEHINFKHIPVIFLSAKATLEDRLKSISLGAVDFMAKPFSFAELEMKIKSILINAQQQKVFFFNQAMSKLPHGVLSMDDKFHHKCRALNLTPREEDVVQLIQGGATYKQIAGILFVSPRTVAKHMQNIFKKVGVSNKAKLIRIFNP